VTTNPDSRRYPTPLLFTLFFVTLFALHAPLLRLPYFWDEAGYYIPAAHDLLTSGSLIPHSTLSNAHPPLVMAWLALAWKVLGFTPAVTRTGMLLIAAFALLGVFRLAQRVANSEVAIASTICTALYPVFFTQSSLAHLDLAAGAFTFWGLLAYVEDRRPAIVVWFSLAVLTKETAIVAPLAVFAWELLAQGYGPLIAREGNPPRYSFLASLYFSGTPTTTTAPDSSSATPNSFAITCKPLCTHCASCSPSACGSGNFSPT
jgi:hypothetical protein